MSVGKKIKKITSIILIIAMVMTSGGIQTFANSVDEIANTMANEKRDDDPTHLNFAEKENKNSEEVIDREEENSQEQTLDEKENSEEENGKSEVGEPEEDEEESESTPVQDDDEESKGIKEGESDNKSDETSDVESSSTLDAENDKKIEEEEQVATESDASYDADTEEAAVATDSDADEEKVDDADGEKIGIATYSEVFTVATEGEVDRIIDIATDSELLESLNLDLLSFDEASPSEAGVNLFGGYGDAVNWEKGVDWAKAEPGDKIKFARDYWEIVDNRSDGTAILINSTYWEMDYVQNDGILNEILIEWLKKYYNSNFTSDEKSVIVPETILIKSVYDTGLNKNPTWKEANYTLDVWLPTDGYMWYKVPPMGERVDGQYWEPGDRNSYLRCVTFKNESSKGTGQWKGYANNLSGKTQIAGCYFGKLWSDDGHTYQARETVQIRINPVIKVNKNSDYWRFPTITYDLEDGHSGKYGKWDTSDGKKPGADSYRPGTAYVLPTNIIAPPGKKFDYWVRKYGEYDYGNYPVKRIEADDVFNDKAYKAVYKNAGDTYFIIWSIYDRNKYGTPVKGYWNGEEGAGEYTEGIGYKLPDNVKSRVEGHVFDYWTIDGERVTEISKTRKGNVIVNANFKEIAAEINYDLSDDETGETGTWDETPGAEWYTYGKEYVLPRNVIGPTGRNFDYWRERWGSGEKITKITATNTGEFWLDAVYKDKEYDIQFKANKAKGSDGKDYGNNTNKTVTTYKYKEKVTMPKATDFAIEGFELIGFSKNANATTATWLPNKEYNVKDMSLSEVETNDIYPIYKEKEYSIGFKGGKKTGSDAKEYSSSNTTAVKKYKYCEAVPIPSNYTIDGDFEFTGMTDTEKDGIKKFDKGETYTVALISAKVTNLSDTADNYLYGTYDEKKVSINFKGGIKVASDGNKKVSDDVTSKEYAYKSKVTIPNNFTLEGLNFKGYDIASNSSIVKINPTDDMTASEMVGMCGQLNGQLDLYGVWEEKEYRLEILGGSKTISSKTYTSNDKVDASKYIYYSSITMPSTSSVTLKGFKLAGFNKEDNQAAVKYKPGQVVKVSDIVSYASMKEDDDTDATINKLYAVWEIDNKASTVTFNADKGVFNSNNTRTKTLKLDNPGAALKTYADYEEPITVADMEFDSWVDNDGVKWTKDDVIIGENNLKATYKKVGGGELGEEEKQKYTIKVLNDTDKGIVKVSGVESTDAKFSIKVGDKILETLEGNAITLEDKPGWNFEGWSFNGGIDNIIKDTDTYTDTEKASITAVYTQIINVNVTLKANTGIFMSDSSREKKLIASVSTALRAFDLYEEPKKAGDYEFEKWVDQNGNEIKATDIIYKDKVLKAVYKDKTTGEEVGNTDDTSTDGKDATYTVTLETDTTKGTLGSVTKFEIKKNENVAQVMKDAGIVDPTANDNYYFWGWSFSDNIEEVINATTTYTKLDDTVLYAEYYEKKVMTVTLDANTGLFGNNETTKTITSDKWIKLNEFEGYELPEKSAGYTFNGWVDADKNAFAEDTLIKSITSIKLYATYKDPSGNVIGGDIKTEDGGTDATYTVRLVSLATMGELGSVKSFEIKLGGVVLDAMDAAGVVDPQSLKAYNYFRGWSFDNTYETIVTDESTYDDSSKRVIHAMYARQAVTVEFDANTGIFESDKSRTKILVASGATAIKDFADYEIPKKSAAYDFDRWVDTKGNTVEEDTLILENTMLKAVYKDKKTGEEIGNTDDTSTDGKDATYTVTLETDTTKGTLGSVTYFEIKKNENVAQVMKDAGVVDPTASDNYYFWGWSFTDNLEEVVNVTTTYTKLDDTVLYAEYYEKKVMTVTLDANTGLFGNNETTKTITSDKWIKLNEFEGYELPEKSAGYTFNGWVDADKNAFAEDTLIKSITSIKLYATYKDSTGRIIGADEKTEEGGADATYTVRLTSLATMGEIGRVKSFEIKLGSKVLNTMNAAGVVDPQVLKSYNYFKGWSFDNSFDALVTDESTYDDSSKRVIHAMYARQVVSVEFDANTGIFESNKSRVKVLIASGATAIKDFADYEIPKKSDAYDFDRWIDAKGKVINEDTLILENTVLRAVYKERNTGKEVGHNDDTSTDGKDATYTVTLETDTTKGTLGSVTYFEIKKNENVAQVMKDAGVVDPTTTEDWNFWGWSFTGDIADVINKTTTYTNIDNTILYAEYYDKNVMLVILDANTGIFSDNTITKTITSDKWLELNKFTNYETPEKSEGYTFNGWIDEAKNAFAEDTLIQSVKPVKLYATYKDSSGKVIGGDDKTEDGGDDATYTVRLVSLATMGELGSVKSFEIKLGDLVLSKMTDAGVTEPTAKGVYVFVGWSFDNDYATTLIDSTTYDNSSKRILHALYSSEKQKITLKANTGIFSDDAREKIIEVYKYTRLIDDSNYEEPKKADGLTFDRWERDGVAITNLDKYIVYDDMTLVAIYKTQDGSNSDIGKGDGTEEGGKNASYTLRVINDDAYGDYTGAETFEVKEGESIYATMKAAGVKEGEPKTGYAFKGWRYGSKLISALTAYDDTNISKIYLEYNDKTTELTFDASFGRFKDKLQVKTYNVSRGRVINTIAEYEEPIKSGWTFSRWVDETGTTVASTSEIPADADKIRLKAMYTNKEGVEVNEDSHNHLICGGSDESASHMTDIIAGHNEKVSYYPITTAEELVNYVNAELAKPVTDRGGIRVHLENNIELNSDIELDNGTNLYICLNGYTLKARKLTNKANESGNIYITNCRDDEASVVENTTSNDLTKALFGGNALHVLSAKGKINLVPASTLVKVVSTDSIVEKSIELMNVNIKSDKDATIERLVQAEGNSRICLVDVDINDVKVTDTLIAAYDGAKLYIGNDVNITNNTTNKSLMDVRDVFNVSDNATLKVEGNTIEKKENGDTAAIFISGDDNYVGGDLSVKNNKLELTDDYKNFINTAKTKADDIASNSNALYGTYDEKVSPAGEVGYSAAIAFTKDDTGFNVGNAKIEIYGNESAEGYSDERAGYMYQVRAKSNTSNALIKQNIGTALDENSVIGVAFATEDGEGLLTNSAKIGKDVFRNDTFGKEEKLLNIKEDNNQLELLRKTYIVEYGEGAPTTYEKKEVIDTLLPDGTVVTENTRVRSGIIKAGHDIRLAGNDIYRVKGFDLATYSLINKNNELIGEFNPKATVSYADDIFGDGEDIEDGEVIYVDPNWLERNLKSEARPLVISKEQFDNMVNGAVIKAVVKAASTSETDQAIEDSEDNYYTVRYHLRGGQFEGIDMQSEEYFEETRVSKKETHILLENVIKIATESGVRKEYDFICWSTEMDDVDGENALTEITEEYAAEISESNLIEVYAQYLPSTYKITYHLEGGKVEGYEGDTIEETVRRLANYTLIQGVTKTGNIFTEWKVVDGDSIMYVKELPAETVRNDIDAYAQYESALYEVTYNLNGGVIRGLTNEGDKTFVDKHASILKDYYLPKEVTKENHKFLGWENVNGVTVEKIAAGDTDMNKRNVTAAFAPTSWKIIYDTDGGTIEGFNAGSVTENVQEGTEYKLYTNVTKPNFEFAYWYDVKSPTTKVEVIKDVAGGKEFTVKAKYYPLTYDLNLHIDGNTRVIKNINNKVKYELPVDIKVADKEFVNWSYKDANGSNVVIDSIAVGNPNNITDVYATYEDLMTTRIVYHLADDEFIDGVEEYDPVASPSTTTGKTKTVYYNRRTGDKLYSNVRKEGEGYLFYGWSCIPYEPDSLEEYELGNAAIRYAEGVDKETEQNCSIEIRDLLIYGVYDRYPYFVKEHEEKADIEYHYVNGGVIPGKELVDGKYIEKVDAGREYVLDDYYSLSIKDTMCDGYEFEGFYLNSECTGSPVYRIDKAELQKKADAKEVLDVYVKFNKVKYNLTYHVEGGSMPGKRLTNNSTIYKTTYDNRNDVTLDTNIIKPGYAFDGWKVSEEANADKMTKIDKGYAEDVEVFASWKKDTYTVTFVLEGGRVNGKPAGSYTQTFSRMKTNALETKVSKNGHKFVGWYTLPSGAGSHYEELAPSDDEIDDFTLFANYKPTSYTVTYMLNGGQLKGKRLTKDNSYVETYDSKKEVKLYTKNDVICDDGIFTGWVDADGKSYVSVEEDHEGDLVLYAEYSRETVDITFNIGKKGIASGRVTRNGKFTQTYNLGADMVLPTDMHWEDTKKNVKTGKTYEEYYFVGWYAEPDCSGEKITTIPKGNPQNITELYAKWEYGVYFIFYHLNGGNIPGIVRIDIFDYSTAGTNVYEEYELPQNTKKSYHVFNGWYEDEDCEGTPITKLTSMPEQRKDGIVHLYAKWTQVQYPLTYVTEINGSYYSKTSKTLTVENDAPYVLAGEEESTLKDYLNENLGFDGWYKKEKGKYVGDEVIYLDTNTTGEVTVYSKLVKLNDLSEEELEKYNARKETRAKKVAEARAYRQSVITKNSGDAGKETEDNLQIGKDGYYSFVSQLALEADEEVKTDVQSENESTNTKSSKKLFGGLFGGLFGDDTPQVATSNEILVNISDLHAYDTVSADKLGVTTPKGTVLDCIVITYLKDADGNYITDPNYIGGIFKAGGNFANIADEYPGYLLGVRAVFIDEKLVEEPAAPTKPTRPTRPINPYYPSDGGGSKSGSRGGNAGGAAAGRKSANFNGWIYDLTGWSYHGYDKDSIMEDRLAGGIFKVPVGDNEYKYYGFDNKGYMVTGFDNFYENTYYFNENKKSIEYGTLSFDSIVMNGKEYIIHPEYGELMGITDNVANVAANGEGNKVVEGNWSGSWGTNVETGAKGYVLSDGTRKLPINGSVKIGNSYYVFNTRGEMQVGLVKYRGSYYYLSDSVTDLGALYVGHKNVAGVDLYFDGANGGKLANENTLEQLNGAVKEYNNSPKVNVSELGGGVANTPLINS